MATQARSPAELAARAAPPPASLITVPVEVRALRVESAVRCTPTTEVDMSVAPFVPPGARAAVVSRLPSRDGDLLAEGDVVVEVAARPVFFLLGALPAFRDLGRGARGVDVRQLQQSLVRLGVLSPASVTGDYDGATTAAVASLYRARGYGAPTRLPADEVIFAPSPTVQLHSRGLRRGEVLGAGDVSVSGGERLLSCPLVDVEPELGAAVRIDVPGRGVVLGVVREVRSGGGGGGQGVVVVTPSEDVVATPGVDSFEATIALTAQRVEGPVVPISALWARSQGAVVKRVRGGEVVEVPVVVALESLGLVAVTPHEPGALQAGDAVVVGDTTGQGGA